VAKTIGALCDELLSSCIHRSAVPFAAQVRGRSGSVGQKPATLALVRRSWNAGVTVDLWRQWGDNTSAFALNAWVDIPKDSWPAAFDRLKRATPTPEARHNYDPINADLDSDSEPDYIVTGHETRVCGFSVARPGAPRLQFDLVCTADDIPPNWGSNDVDIGGPDPNYGMKLFVRPSGGGWGTAQHSKELHPLFSFYTPLEDPVDGAGANMLLAEKDVFDKFLIPALGLASTWTHPDVCRLLTGIAMTRATQNMDNVGPIGMHCVMNDICLWEGEAVWFRSDWPFCINKWNKNALIAAQTGSHWMIFRHPSRQFSPSSSSAAARYHSRRRGSTWSAAMEDEIAGSILVVWGLTRWRHGSRPASSARLAPRGSEQRVRVPVTPFHSKV